MGSPESVGKGSWPIRVLIAPDTHRTILKPKTSQRLTNFYPQASFRQIVAFLRFEAEIAEVVKGVIR